MLAGRGHGLITLVPPGHQAITLLSAGEGIFYGSAEDGRPPRAPGLSTDSLHSPRRAISGYEIRTGFVGLDDSGANADSAVINGYKPAWNRPPTRSQKLPMKALATVRAPVWC